jgi:hypothetical protein
MPGAFRFDRLLADEYELQFASMPAGAYAKQVTSAGRSFLHRPLPAGAIGSLRVILARDGGHITLRTDPEAWVVAVPASATTEIDVADTMVCGRADAAGTWISPLLAPGKYLVMTSPAPVDRSVEAVERVFRARSKAQEVDLTPNGSVVVKLN